MRRDARWWCGDGGGRVEGLRGAAGGAHDTRSTRNGCAGSGGTWRRAVAPRTSLWLPRNRPAEQPPPARNGGDAAGGGGGGTPTTDTRRRDDDRARSYERAPEQQGSREWDEERERD